MNGETFTRETLRCLEAQLRRYPAMRAEDAVKFAFQAMLGVGHLLADGERAVGYLVREMDGLRADPSEPLFEELSPDWCRLNLRRAMAEGMGAEMIAGMMRSSGGARFSRREALALCEAACAVAGLPMPEGTEELLREDWLPAHSTAYRELYHPAYRVVASGWMRCEAALRAILQKRKGTERLLVTLDGPCAAGKTTLAERLAGALGAAVAHTDDYVIPHSQKTPERLAIPGGNCDAERLAREVLIPWKAGRPMAYRAYDCAADRILPARELPEGDVLILEGCYCNLPILRERADVRLFLDAPWAAREKRLLQRESADSMRQFRARWIPLENAYFAAYRLPDAGCVRICLPEAE